MLAESRSHSLTVMPDFECDRLILYTILLTLCEHDPKVRVMNHESRRSAIHKVIFVIIGACVLGSSCRDNAHPTIWKTEVRSPDGLFLAIACTDQNGGFGSASIDTMVFLQQPSQSPVMVLAFDCEGPAPRPYVLDNKANAGGTISLNMKWVGPSHLEVTYNGHATLSFQAVKYAGVIISVRNLSMEAIISPREHRVYQLA